MKKILLLFLCLLLLSSCSVAYAHTGGTDSSGGHYNRSTREYHYHHGYSAHQHEDMDGDGVLDCPYNFVDATDHDSSSDYSGENIATNENLPLPSKEDNHFDFEFIMSAVCTGLFLLFVLIKFIFLPIYYWIIEPIVNFFKEKIKKLKFNKNKGIEIATCEDSEEYESSQFYTGSKEIRMALKNIPLDNLSSDEKGAISNYFLNIRCMQKNIKKFEEIKKYRVLLNDPYYEQDDFKLYLKKIIIYKGIILDLEEKIKLIVKKQPIS